MWHGVSNKIRATLAILGFAGALAFPPWVPLFSMFALSLRYAAWEIIAIGALVDFLWLAPSTALVASPSGVEWLASSLPLFTLIGLALAWGLEPLRSEFLS